MKVKALKIFVSGRYEARSGEVLEVPFDIGHNLIALGFAEAENEQGESEDEQVESEDEQVESEDEQGESEDEQVESEDEQVESEDEQGESEDEQGEVKEQAADIVPTHANKKADTGKSCANTRTKK